MYMKPFAFLAEMLWSQEHTCTTRWRRSSTCWWWDQTRRCNTSSYSLGSERWRPKSARYKFFQWLCHLTAYSVQNDPKWKFLPFPWMAKWDKRAKVYTIIVFFSLMSCRLECGWIQKVNRGWRTRTQQIPWSALKRPCSTSISFSLRPRYYGTVTKQIQ